MYISTREESIKRLSEKLDAEQLRKVITRGYSDISLSVMADFNEINAKKMADSSYSADIMNKLTEAYSEEKINIDELLGIANYSLLTDRNAAYVDDFLKSIDNGVSHDTVSKVFMAVNYDNCTYSEAMDYVKSGAFYPTEYSSLSVTNETAEQLHEIGIPLRACEGFNFCWNVEDLNEAFEKGAAIFVQEKDLAVKVHEMMKQPEWESFKAYVIRNGNCDQLTASDMDTLHNYYEVEKNAVKLYEKVEAEYNDFMLEMLSGTTKNAVDNAYSIVAKTDILSYCENSTPELTDKQYAALMTSKNTLEEVYEVWCNNSEWHGLDDIGLAIEETADRIGMALEREQNMKKTIDEPKSEHETKPSEQQIKPKRKSR